MGRRVGELPNCHHTVWYYLVGSEDDLLELLVEIVASSDYR